MSIIIIVYRYIDTMFIHPLGIFLKESYIYIHIYRHIHVCNIYEVYNTSYTSK